MRVRSAMLRHVLTACSLTVIVSADVLSSQLTTLTLTTGDDPWSPVIGDTEGLPDVTLAPLNISSLSGRRAVNLVENIRRKLMHDNYDYSGDDSKEHDLGTSTNNTTPENTEVMQIANENMPNYANIPFQVATTTPDIDTDSSMQRQELLAKDLIYYVDENKLRRSNHNQNKPSNMSSTYKIIRHIQANNTINNKTYVSNPRIARDDQKFSGRRHYQYRQERKNYDVPSTTFDGVYRGPMNKKPDKDDEIHDNSNYYANLIVPSTKRSRSYRRHKRRKQLLKMRSGLKRRAQKYIESDYESDESFNDKDNLHSNQRWKNKRKNVYVIEELYRRSAHNKDLKPSNNYLKKNPNVFNDAQIVQQSTQDVRLHNDSGKLEQSTTSKVKYKLIKVKSRVGFRRKSDGQRQFLQERGPDGVALISLDGGPFPQFRLPRARRQYMFEDLDPRPPLIEQLPKSAISRRSSHRTMTD